MFFKINDLKYDLLTRVMSLNQAVGEYKIKCVKSYILCIILC